MTIYVSDARRHADELLVILAAHVAGPASGRCVACHGVDPCVSRRNALYALAIKYRRADATHPANPGVRRVRVEW